MKRQGGSWVIHIPSREQNLMQVRPAGQAGYPISLVASLDTVPVKCCVPLHKWLENLVEQTTNKSKKQTEGSFTSVQMVHTHTLTSDIYTYDRYTHTYIYIYTYDYIHTYAQIARYIDI